MTEIMIKILFDVLCPLLVSVYCFQIQYREQIRNDKKELFPPMHAALFYRKRGSLFAQGQDSCWWKNCGAHI